MLSQASGYCLRFQSCSRCYLGLITSNSVFGFPHPTNAATAFIKKTCFMPATLRRRLEELESLLAGVHADECAGGVAGVYSAVRKNGDGPATALEDLGLGDGGKAFGRSGPEGEFAFLAKDE